MKIFIGGSKTIEEIDDIVKQKLLSMIETYCDVIIGDCRGIDTAVQRFFEGVGYRNVEIYASNGIVRNNLGNWAVHNVPVKEGIKGFEFYRQKDIAMANDADCGFMIWDENSKGTLNNLIDLAKRNKKTVIYRLSKREMHTILNLDELSLFVSTLDKSIQNLYEEYILL